MTTGPDDDATRASDRLRPAAHADAVQRLLTDMDEVLRLQRRAEARVDAGTAERCAGLSVLLDETLPHDAAVEARLARALRLEDGVVRQFRRREIDPSELPAEPLAALGRALTLDWQTFDLLVSRDLTWFAEESPLAMLRETTTDPQRVRTALREAWDRDALDDPQALGGALGE